VRLCALWDGADRHKENVPTIIRLVNDADVLTMLTEETRAYWANRMRQNGADEQADKTAQCLDDAIAKAKSVIESPMLASVLNIRNKHLAQSLAQTRLEQKESVRPMTYGDESWLFEETVEIVDGLHTGINGIAMQWNDARQIARKNAEALWNSCTFTITD
jgi:hypothetical protein